MFFSLISELNTRGTENEIIEDVLKLFQRHFGPGMAAIVCNRDDRTVIKNIIPKKSKKMEDQDGILKKILESGEPLNGESLEYGHDSQWYYSFRLGDYGSIILGRKTRFDNPSRDIMAALALAAGKWIQHAVERDQWAGFIEERDRQIAFLRTILDNVPISIYTKDPDLKKTMANRAELRRLGVESEEQVLGKDDDAFYGVEFCRSAKEEDMQVLQGKKPILSREVRTSPDEWSIISKIPLFGDDGALMALLGTSIDITARKKAEMELLRAKQQIESIFGKMEDVIWSVSLPGHKLLFMTPSAEKLYEVPNAIWEENTEYWITCIHPEDVHVVDEISKKIEKEHNYEVTYRIITGSGSVKWVRNRGRVIFGKDNEPVRLDGIIRDVTEQHRQEDLIVQHTELQNILISLSSSFMNVDLDKVESAIQSSLQRLGEFVNADRVYIFSYDFTRNVSSNTHEWCAEGIHPEIENLQDVPVEFIPQWVEKHQQGEPFYVEDVLTLPDEGPESLRGILEPQGIKSLLTLPMLDHKGLYGFVGFDSVREHHHYSDKELALLEVFSQMLVNVNQRRLYVNALLNQEEKYRNIISNLNMGLVEISLENRIRFANQTFLETAGLSLGEIRNVPAYPLLFGAGFYDETKEQQQRLLENAVSGLEVFVPGRNGHKRWWFVSLVPNFNDKGDKVGHIGIIMDITGRKELELELAEAKAEAEKAALAKEHFLANMSHEIRTPLNVIIGMVRELNKQNLGADQRFYVAQSDSAAKHLLTVLNQILDMAKIDSGKFTLESLDFSLATAASNAFSILYSQAKEKNINFDLYIDERLHRAHVGDEGRLRQIFINFLGNAIKFTEKGSVNFRLDLIGDSPDSQQVRFTVRDTGIGMSDEFQKILFQKFAQEQELATRKYEGTGLGMAIAREIIMMMGGDIEIDSKKGFGTTIRFELELPKGDITRLRSFGSKVEQNIFKDYRILLVEDNEMNRFIALQSLHFFGCKVDEAVNGLEAVEKARENEYDLILMDIQMPEMDGVQAARIIRDELKREVPVVALTANAFRHDIDKYLKAGMVNYVTKPFTEEELSAVLAKELPNPGNDGGLAADTLLYDIDVLRKISHGNEAFEEKMIHLFLDLSDSAITELNEAMDSEDYSQTRSIAHRIKPSIDNMGIESLRGVIRDLESFPTDGDAGRRKELVQLVTKTLHKVRVQLKSR